MSEKFQEKETTVSSTSKTNTTNEKETTRKEQPQTKEEKQQPGEEIEDGVVIKDAFLVDAIRQFKKDAKKKSQTNQNRNEFDKWNSTSIGLSNAVLLHFLQHKPLHPARVYVETILRDFVKWYDSFWWFAKPIYRVPYCIDTTREILQYCAIESKFRSKFF